MSNVQGCTVQKDWHGQERSKFACGVEWEECPCCGEDHPTDAEEKGYFDCRQDCFRGAADHCSKCDGWHPLEEERIPKRFAQEGEESGQ